MNYSLNKQETFLSYQQKYILLDKNIFNLNLYLNILLIKKNLNYELSCKKL